MGNFPFYADDAYIHLRFAHHLASGEGIVWNKGEAPVEGSTSFLYLLMIAVIEILGVQPVWTLSYISAIFSTFLLLNTFLLLQFLKPDNLLVNLLVTVMLGFFHPIMVWSISGLEVMVYAFAMLLCASLYILYHHKIISPYIVGIVFAITSFIRPECLMLFGVTATYDICVNYFSKTKAYIQSLKMIGGFLIIYLPVFFWKWSYFGYPFPNTYYAKTGGGMIQILAGLDYLRSNFIENFSPTILLAILFLITFRKDSLLIEKAYLFLLLTASWCIVAINGGDYMGKARFLTPTISFFYILGSFGISALLEKIIKSVWQYVILFAFLITAFVDWQIANPVLTDLGRERFPGAAIGYKPKYVISTPEFAYMGKALQRIVKPNESIALVPIGAIGYYSEMTVYDMVGLVDTTIAHEPFAEQYILDSWKPGHDKGNGSYILSLKPTYILLVDRLTFEPIEGVDDWASQYKSIVELWGSEEFHTQYHYCPFQVNGWYINLYCRTEIYPNK